ncbi:MAG: nucleoside-diphosphate kinase [Chloroflexi bacterium]|nr:nucleoside-diphosphate kinase [Chloroflexota bacterium]
MSKDLAGKHYSVHIGKSFYDGLVAYITSCPIIAAVLEGPRAVEVVRKTMGATDSAKAEMGTIRGDFGITIGRNLVHGSDSVENAEKEIKIFFTEKELVTYHRDIDQWIIES